MEVVSQCHRPQLIGNREGGVGVCVAKCYCGSPAVRPALSAALSSCTRHTNVHISVTVVFFCCKP